MAGKGVEEKKKICIVPLNAGDAFGPHTHHLASALRVRTPHSAGKNPDVSGFLGMFPCGGRYSKYPVHSRGDLFPREGVLRLLVRTQAIPCIHKESIHAGEVLRIKRRCRGLPAIESQVFSCYKISHVQVSVPL